MPKIKKRSAEEEILLGEIRKEFGYMVTVTQARRIIGCRSYDTAYKFLADLPVVNINGKRMYQTSDITRKIFENREERC